MNEMTIEHAKEMRTTKGAIFVELAKSQLEWIRDSPTTTSAQKEAARLILEDRERVEAAKATYATGTEVAPPAAFPPTPKAVPDGIVASHLLEITQKLERLEHQMEDLGIQVSTSISAIEREMAEIGQAFKKAANAPAGQAATPITGQNGGGSFITDVIETEKRKGKTYFKVKGGRFTKHGVTVWPEVLEAAGFDPADFPVGEETQFVGHTAIFTNAEPNDEGKVWPDKIIKITPKF